MIYHWISYPPPAGELLTNVGQLYPYLPSMRMGGNPIFWRTRMEIR
jgi:hypothetical protein